MKIISKLFFNLCSICFIRPVFDKWEYVRNRNYYGDIKQEISEGWSFVIVTDGKDQERLEKVIQSIKKEFELQDNYEILFVGKLVNTLPASDKIKIVDYYSFPYLPGRITSKKNIGVRLAKYNNVVVMHDYVRLCKGWYEQMKQFSEDYDVCLNQVLLKNGYRSRDWVVMKYPNIGPGLIPYHIVAPKFIYINGTFFIVKKDFFMKNQLDEHLRWGEGEDISWSESIIKKGARIKINKNAIVQFIKDKAPNDAPYCQNWIENTIKLYSLYGITISKDKFKEDVKEQ